MNALSHFITENGLDEGRVMDRLQDEFYGIADNCIGPDDADPDSAQAAVEWLLERGIGR